MAILSRVALLFLSSCFLLFGCGDALVDDSYRGEPLTQIKGQLRSFEPGRPSSNQFYVSVFWSTSGLPVIDTTQLVEQDSVGVKLEFPNSFLLNVFDVPTAAGQVVSVDGKMNYWLGMLLIYEDVNGDQRFDSSELRGGAEDTILIYSKTGLDAASSPTGRRLSAGYQVMRLPISCTCDARVGEACFDDFDCGTYGFCLNNINEVEFSGGYCTVQLDNGNCLPDGSKGMIFVTATATDTPPVFETLAYKKCANDSECRSDEGYLCCQGICRPPELEFECPVFQTCDVPIGASCSKDSDCGAQGKCLTRFGFDTYINGYCSLPADSACTPDSAVAVYRGNAVSGESEPQDYYHLQCNSDKDCRTDEGYACSIFESVCAPVEPVYLTVDQLFTPSALCRASY